MNNYAYGATAGIGAGLLIGWSLGASGIMPGQGTSLWAMTAIGIILLTVGTIGLRQKHPA